MLVLFLTYRNVRGNLFAQGHAYFYKKPFICQLITRERQYSEVIIVGREACVVLCDITYGTDSYSYTTIVHHKRKEVTEEVLR